MAANDRRPADPTVLCDIDVNTDRLIDALSNARRRFVLARLYESDTPMDLDDVADELVTWEGDEELTDRSGEAFTSAHLSLHHIHVPKLADLGLVEYEREENVVALTDHSDEFRTLVDRFAGEQRRSTTGASSADT